MCAAGNHLSVINIVDIAECIHCDDCAHFNPASLYSICAKAAFHRARYPAVFADGASHTGACISLRDSIAGSILAGAVSHRRIRAHIHSADSQVEQAGGAYQRNLRYADVEADAVLFKIFHYTAPGVQPEGGAAGKQERVQPFGICQRIQQRRLAGSRTASAHTTPAGEQSSKRMAVQPVIASESSA